MDKEELIKPAEDELKHTIEVVPGIIAKANAQTGYFTHCNPALSSILGFSSKEFLAQPFIEFIYPDDRLCSKPDDFDLVISDMTMPNMTGDELAMKLISTRHDIPVILCTGYSKKISEESAAEIGIKAFVYKPVVKADLSKTVRKVLDEAKGKTP
jgi:CheY-like chemotaxis protein